MDVAALVNTAIEAALAAGQEILAVYGTDFGTEHKPDHSPITEADRKAHVVIRNVLAGTALPVVSEEGRIATPAERSAWSSYWLVDPLDGTREFVQRNGQFTVNIALMARSEAGGSTPVAGVLYAPVPDTLYFAWQGGGAHRSDRAMTQPRIDFVERTRMSESLPTTQRSGTFTILASRSHRDAATEAYIRSKEHEHGRVAVTPMGSALKFGLMAEGAADAYPRFGPTMEWDTAAGQAICEEAGLQVVDLTTGATLSYDKHDLMNPPFIVRYA
jgi:3'(2'), 5'-bisphosphate nucleotidase